jgi:hypothetical protein
MKPPAARTEAPARDTRLDRLEVYSWTARGVLLLLTVLLATAVVTGTWNF